MKLNKNNHIKNISKENYIGGEGKIETVEHLINYLFNTILCHWWLLALLLLSIFVGIIFIVFNVNPFNIGTKYPHKSTIGVGIFGMFLMSIFLYVYYFNKTDDPNGKNCIQYTAQNNIFGNDDFKKYLIKFLLLLGTISLILVIIFWVYFIITSTNNLSSIVENILTGLFILITLAIIFILSSEDNPQSNKKKSFENASWTSFILQIIFFIPCLFIDLIEYIKKQIKITTKPVWILFILEIIIIILYFLIPFVYKKISLHEGNEILKGPIYTNNITNLGNYQSLTLSKNINFNYNYGISFFLYINPQPTSTSPAYTQFTSLFNYANKPNILYNAEKNILKIVCQNNRNDLVNIYEMKNIQYQKWMHFVINYNSGTVDVFIDNNLVGTKSGIAPYMTLDKITAGTKNGINGGIKNVIYFNKIIPKNQIALLLNLN